MPAFNHSHKNITRFAIILGLGLVIFLPRPLLGWRYLENAARYEAQGKFGQASHAYEEASFRCWWQQGLVENAGFAALKAADEQNAIRFFTESFVSGDLSDQGRMALGELLSKVGQPEKAVTIWKTIGTGSDYAAASFFERAALETGLGSFYQAADLWRQGLLLDPSNDLARYNLGLILAAIEPVEAIPELEQVSGLQAELMAKASQLAAGLRETIQSDDLAFQLVGSGRLLASIQEWELAYFAFQNSINLNPRYSEAWAWLGESAQQLGKDPLPALQRSLELDPGSITSLAFNGLYFRRNDQPEKALVLYEKVAQLDPANATWQIILGEIHARAGDFATALDYFQAAVATSPLEVQTWQAMLDFSIYYQVYVDQVALEAAIQIFKLEPDSWISFDNMGQVMMWTGKYDLADFYFNRSIEIDPDQAASHLHLGLLYLLINKDSEAIPELQKALALAPGSPAGLQAGQLLDQYPP